MMPCPKCRNVHREGAAFCARCGAELESDEQPRKTEPDWVRSEKATSDAPAEQLRREKDEEGETETEGDPVLETILGSLVLVIAAGLIALVIFLHDKYPWLCLLLLLVVGLALLWYVVKRLWG